MERIKFEKSTILDNKAYDLKTLYTLILNKKLYFNEIGGYVKDNKFVSKALHIEYDYEADKPYYLFDFTRKYFKTNNVLWHLHPYQGDKVWNCYPSYQDLQTMSNNPKKVLLLITKCGLFIYFSKVDFRYEFNIDEYKDLLENVFRNQTVLNKNSFVKTDYYAILYYNRLIPTHEKDVFTNLSYILWKHFS